MTVSYVTDAIRDCIGIAGKDLQATANAELSRLLAALTASEKDAARWTHARKFLAVEDIERWSGYGWQGHHPDEQECAAADAAIDRIITKEPK